MANISYTNTKASAQLEMITDEMTDVIEALIKSGPHSDYSSKNGLLKDMIKVRRQTIEESKTRATHDSTYTSDVIEYPSEKEAS